MISGSYNLEIASSIYSNIIVNFRLQTFLQTSGCKIIISHVTILLMHLLNLYGVHAILMGSYNSYWYISRNTDINNFCNKNLLCNVIKIKIIIIIIRFLF